VDFKKVFFKNSIGIGDLLPAINYRYRFTFLYLLLIVIALALFHLSIIIIAQLKFELLCPFMLTATVIFVTNFILFCSMFMSCEFTIIKRAVGNAVIR